MTGKKMKSESLASHPLSKGFVLRPRRALDWELLKCVGWAMLGKAVLHPWERATLVFQVQMVRPPGSQLKTWGYSWNGAKAAGFWSLWSGARVAIMRAIPSYTLVLSCYAALTNAYIPDHHNRFPQLNQKALETNVKVYGAAGACGGFLSTLFTHPFDVLHTRMASDTFQPLRYNSLTSAVISCLTHTETGLASLWRGFFSSLCSAMVYRSFQFIAYGFLKHTAIRAPEQATFLQLSGCALTASLLAQLLTYPTQLTRKVFMLRDELAADLAFWKKQPPSMVSPTLGIEGELYWREPLMEKLKTPRLVSMALNTQSGGMYKGFIPNMAQAVPFSVALVLFDLVLIRKKAKIAQVYPMPPPFDYKEQISRLNSSRAPSPILPSPPPINIKIN